MDPVDLDSVDLDPEHCTFFPCFFQCCESGMFILDPVFYPSQIPRFHKIENYFIFEMLKKKIWANFQRITELFIQKIVTKLSKIWVWDLGSEIQDPEKTYSGSRIQGSKRHRINYHEN